jgi:hypothetical protein
MGTEFTLTVGSNDWDAQTGGWRCPALQIPGAEVAAIYSGGRRADSTHFVVEHGVIRWTQKSHPSDAAVTIRLTRDLGKEIPELEAKKFTLERSKVRWQGIAILLGFAGTMAGLLVTKLQGSVDGKKVEAAAATSPHETVVACRQNLAKLRALMQLPNESADDTRAAVTNLVLPCQDLVNGHTDP